MICSTCSNESNHIRITARGMTCHNCGGWAETAGGAADKILTRNASRVTTEHIQYEGDVITPYIVDKVTHKPIVNEDFINLYPDAAGSTYTADELKSVGQPDLKPAVTEKDMTGIEFSGDESEAVSAIVGDITQESV